MLLLHKSQHLNKDTKERKSLFEVKRKLLKYSICSCDGKNLNSKKDGNNKLKAITVGNLVWIHSSDMENNTYFNCSTAA